MSGEEYDLSAITGEGSCDSGVPHGKALVRFAESVLGEDEIAVASSRQEVLDKVGPEGFVDAAAVVATFSTVDRIADSTGIPLDGMLDVMTVDMRTQIGLDRFSSAANTPRPGTLKRGLSRILKPVAPFGMKIMLAIQGKPKG